MFPPRLKRTFHPHIFFTLPWFLVFFFSVFFPKGGWIKFFHFLRKVFLCFFFIHFWKISGNFGKQRFERKLNSAVVFSKQILYRRAIMKLFKFLLENEETAIKNVLSSFSFSILQGAKTFSTDKKMVKKKRWEFSIFF